MESGAQQPKIFCVNWFRTDEQGKFIWPGFGDNMRVLKWMLERVAGKAHAVENVFGLTPAFEDLQWDGIALSADQYAQITSIDIPAWQAELQLHAELFHKLSHHLPVELEQTRVLLEKRLAA